MDSGSDIISESTAWIQEVILLVKVQHGLIQAVCHCQYTIG